MEVGRELEYSPIYAAMDCKTMFKFIIPVYVPHIIRALYSLE